MKKRFFAFILALLAFAMHALCLADGENMLSGGFGAEGQWHEQAWYEGDAYGSITAYRRQRQMCIRDSNERGQEQLLQDMLCR